MAEGPEAGGGRRRAGQWPLKERARPADPPTRAPPVSPTDARILDLPGRDILRALSGRESFGLSPHSGATQPRARGGGRAGVGAGLAAGGPWAGAPARTAGAAGARAPSCGGRRRLRGGATATGQCGAPAAAPQPPCGPACGGGRGPGSGGAPAGEGAGLGIIWKVAEEGSGMVRGAGGFGRGETMGGIVEGGVWISGLGGAFLSVPVQYSPVTSHRCLCLLCVAVQNS